MHPRRLRAVLLAGAVLTLALPATSDPAEAQSARALIQGSGSSWSANAVNQWIADVQPSGLQVVYTASGSAQGRKDFAFKTTDFAVSDIGYQGTDPVTGAVDNSLGREFVYLPIVAGGTSFPYQIKVAGQLVRDLRLSGDTVTKIFTNQITNWNDPQVTADNNGRQFPSLQIVPVVHAEGSGATSQLTRFFDSQHGNVWRPYFGKAGSTEYFPRKGKQIAQNGSDGVMNYVASGAGNGTIGYDEYSYPLAKNYPAAKLLNKAGYYTLPNQFNVAVALTKAQINQDRASPDYLLQNLEQVYSDGDKRTYPLSSYSYGLIPTAANDSRMTTAKRQTLADYLYYSICQGQKEVGPIGYSPLPVNLVQASFEQIGKLKAADNNVDLAARDVTTCKNPTFVAGEPNRNFLAETAPQPPECDKTGAGPCSANETRAQIPGAGGGGGGGGDAGGSTGGGGPAAGAASASRAGENATPSAGASAAAGAAAGGTETGTGAEAVVGGDAGIDVALDPETGLAIGTTATEGTAGGGAVAVATELNSYRDKQMAPMLGGLAIMLLIGAVVLPPILSHRFAQRPGGQA